jgi:hypothetical protein
MRELVEQAWSAPVAAEQPRRGADQLIHKIRGPRPVLEQDQGRAAPVHRAGVSSLPAPSGGNLHHE